MGALFLSGDRNLNFVSVMGITILCIFWYYRILSNNKSTKRQFIFLYFKLDTLFFRLRTISAILLSSTCFRPHRPIMRSKLYMQPMVFSPTADVFVVRPLRKNSEGQNTIGCMYNLDLLMMGLWGLKHVEESRIADIVRRRKNSVSSLK